MTAPFVPRPEPWMADALCKETDPDAFFPEKGGSTRAAKRVCARCEVRLDCLSWALSNGERFGVLGGLSERERRRLHTAPAPKAPRPDRGGPAASGWKWSDSSTKEQVRHLTELGWSARQIGIDLGVTSRTVQRIRAEWRARQAAREKVAS